jgi:hypothetical protein
MSTDVRGPDHGGARQSVGTGIPTATAAGHHRRPASVSPVGGDSRYRAISDRASVTRVAMRYNHIPVGVGIHTVIRG